MNHTFNAYKERIDLVNFAASYGYSIHKKKSTRHSVVMNHINGDKIVISKRNGIWVYFSVFDDNDNGTIVDFTLNRTAENYSQVLQELKQFDPTSLPDINQCKSTKLQEKKFDPERIARLFNMCSPIFESAYLTSRGISKNVLSDSRFVGRIFKDYYNNVAFPHFEKGAAFALELKNKDRGILVSGSKKTFWRSNIRPRDNTIVIAEAPINALSYFALKPLQEAFYVATSGSPSPFQFDCIIKSLSKLNRIKKAILIGDHDAAGIRFNEKFNNAIRQSINDIEIVKDMPKAEGFDWNDVLVDKLNSKPILG